MLRSLGILCAVAIVTVTAYGSYPGLAPPPAHSSLKKYENCELLESINHKLEILLEKQKACDALSSKIDTYHSSIMAALALQSALVTQIGSQSSSSATNDPSGSSSGRVQNEMGTLPRSCAAALKDGKRSGVYEIFIPQFEHPFNVYCLRDENGGAAWTVIQRRIDGTIDFHRNWYDYKLGFGNLETEFFIGLDKLHAITSYEPQELKIDLTDCDNYKRCAKYSHFEIGDEKHKYALLELGGYSGDAGDSLRSHVGRKWTTKDMDNDEYNHNCAIDYTGAWWYAACHTSNLNGRYMHGQCKHDEFGQGIVWKTWTGYEYSLKHVVMAIRPKPHY